MICRNLNKGLKNKNLSLNNRLYSNYVQINKNRNNNLGKKLGLSFVGISVSIFTLYLTLPTSTINTSLSHTLDPFLYSKFKVRNVEQLTNDTKLISIDIPKHKLPPSNKDYPYWVPSISHIWVKQPNIQVERPYTPLEEIKPDTNTIKLLVKRYKDSEVSNYVNDLKLNDDIEIRGPNLTYDLSVKNLKKDDDLVFIVGGTGITPAYQYIKSKLNDNNCPNINLIYSTNSDSYYLSKDLESLKQSNSSKLTINHLDSDNGRINLKYLRKSLGLSNNIFNWWSNDENTLQNKFFIVCGNDG